MKSGATDPFADDSSTDEETDHPDEKVDRSEQSSQPDQQDQDETVDRRTSNTDQYDQSDLPRILTRDTVKEDRDDVHQLFVYEGTSDREKEARRELEDRFDKDLYKLDMREAIYRAGMQNLDDAEEILREWGADI
ncbi:hypothetical protein RBH26_19780 [Natronolimnohabitans sp. A-GB9]|uniref:hypothetical protein n=1 Tax=Natronolimnohabitans sp. A-GB9 TaxID=3069757 RepID=UPI0027B42E43|nr:hypothetical protein [Natronolimnohabitans sp. A-GB9]MDQ2052694.1 hypothetical protein [Natronolimnohabitans sp. A-GB9]